MATNEDSFPITTAMLTYAWVKPATLYYPGGTVTGTLTAGEANATADYLPNTLAEWAGARGTGTAVTSDPNYVFARTMKAGTAAAPSQIVPYVTGLPNDITSSDIITPVECTPTISVP